METKHTSGYYRVKKFNEWTIAVYLDKQNEWYCIGFSQSFLTEDFQEIDWEHPVNPELAKKESKRDLLVRCENFKLFTPDTFSCSDQCIDKFLE